MALVAVDNGSLTVDDAGGEQTVKSVTASAHDVYVAALDFNALVAAEDVVVRCYIELDAASHLHSEQTIVKGTDPDVLILPPTPAVSGKTIVWKVEPGTWAADRAVVWRVWKLP